MIKNWGAFHKRKNQENWKCSAWRRLRGILKRVLSTSWEGMRTRAADPSQQSSLLWQEAMGTDCKTANSIWTQENIYLVLRWPNTGMDWPDRLWGLHPTGHDLGQLAVANLVSAGVLDKAACVLQRCVQPKHLCEWIHYFCHGVKGLIVYFIYMIIITMCIFSYVCVPEISWWTLEILPAFLF